VVISIIALLIALLLPALQAAREEATWIKCLNNQRSVFQATTAAAIDRDGVYLGSYNTSQLGLDEPEYRAFQDYGYKDMVWQCPGREFEPEWNPGSGKFNHGYQYLCNLQTWRIQGTTYKTRSPLNMDDSTRGMALITDATIQPVTGSWAPQPTAYYYSDVPPHVANPDYSPVASNHVFGDGSGERIGGELLIPMSSWTNSRQPHWYQTDLGDYNPY
jgi:hypothetical protein